MTLEVVVRLAWLRQLTRANLWTVLLLAAVWSTGCRQELIGPKPAIENPAPGEPLPVNHGIVCRMQHPEEGTPVLVTGEEFSPMPYDLPGDPKTALPDLTLARSSALDGSAADATEVFFAGEPGEPNAELLTWQSQNQMTLFVKDEVQLAEGSQGMLEEGVYDVLVTNPDKEKATSVGALAVVERPFVEEVAPSIVCIDEGPRDVTVTGQRVLRIDGLEAETVIAGQAFAVNQLSECTEIAHAGIDAEYCETVDITIDQNALEIGYPDVLFQNPESAACVSVHAEDGVNLRVVPEPTIDTIAPPMVCVAEGPRQVTLHGNDFLEIDSTPPLVTVDAQSVAVVSLQGTCQDLETRNHTVQSCSEVTVELPQDATISNVVVPTVVLTNPADAGCGDESSTDLVLVPPPTVASVNPPLVCVNDSDRQVEVIGSGFIFVDGVVPEVTVGSTLIPPAAVQKPADPTLCEVVPVVGLTVERCTSIMVTIAQGTVPVGVTDVSVINPAPAGCGATGSGVLTVIDSPAIAAATPPLTCTDTATRDIVVDGSGFLVVTNPDMTQDLPTVTVGGQVVAIQSIPPASCSPITVAGMTVESCTSMIVTVPQGSLAPGPINVGVANPPPAGCVTSIDTVLYVPPTITLAAANPPDVCESSAGVETVTVTGTGFLRADSGSGVVDFSVDFNGMPVTPVINAASCVALPVAQYPLVESCTEFTVDLDLTGMTSTDAVNITVTNPDPLGSGCTLSSSSLFTIVPPPTVTGVVPIRACAGQPDTVLVITGDNFSGMPRVYVGVEEADIVVVDSSTQITATFTVGLPQAGDYDVKVENAPGCDGNLPNGFTVDPVPLVFFVDPPVVFNGISVDVTIFTSGLDALAAGVELVAGDGTVIPLAYSSPQRPNRIVATIPFNAGSPLDPGNYEVRVTSAYSCVGGLPGGLTITDTETLVLNSVDPQYVSPTESTAVSIYLDGASTVEFEPIPRAYLNPTSGAGTATALKAVVLPDPTDLTRLTAVVPANTPADTYELIVVNPSGAVGRLSPGIIVTPGEPPVITSVIPGSFEAANPFTATVYGENFDTAGVTLELVCRDRNTGAPVAAPAQVAVPIDLQADHVTYPFDTSGIPTGTICLIRLTNDAEGSFFSYSAVSIKSPSGNLNPWLTGNVPLSSGRRGLALVAGRPTNTTRYLYAIGGDDGDPANTFDTVDFINVDAFGNMVGTSWDSLAHADPVQRSGAAVLPEGRAFAGLTTIDRFIYLVGGYDGGTDLDTTVRAQILDPLAAPEISDLDAALGNPGAGSGLDGGLWLYKVAALFPAGDTSNPDGESLPGEALVVELPTVPEKIELALDWEDVVGASGYRIYRTPTVGGDITELQLLHEVNCGGLCTPADSTWVDDGLTVPSAVPGADELPLPPGSLGTWHEPAGALLNSSREGVASVAVQSPGNPDEWFLYAFGGINGGATYLDTYEWTRVDVDPATGEQTVVGWSTSANTIGADPKAYSHAWVVTRGDTTNIPEDDDGSGTMVPRVYVYVGGGFTDAANDTNEVVSGYLDFNSTGGGTGGDLLGASAGSLAAEKKFNQSRGGGVSIAANGYLYIMGGMAAGGGLIGQDSSTDVDVGPVLSNWTALGSGAIQIKRAFAGIAEESAFFFVAGGTTDPTVFPQTLTTSVEQNTK